MKRQFVVLVGLVLLLAALVYAQGKTRGAAEPAIPASAPVYPLVGIDIADMTWSELAAMVAVLAGISGGFQWIITRVIVQPQIEKSLKAATGEIMKSSLEQFTSKYAFVIHETASTKEHEAIKESIEEIVKHQDVENGRLIDVRERVRVLEARRT